MLFSEASKTRTFGAPYSLVSLGSDLADNNYLSAVVRSAPYAAGGELAARSGNKNQVDALKDAVAKILSKDLTVDEALLQVQKVLSQ